MAAKRRKIVLEDFDFGTGLRTIPTDSGGLRIATQINPAIFIQPHFNVKSYGAIGDGSANDTSAIARTLSAAGTNGVIYFPPGTYKVRPLPSTSTFILSDDQRIIGAGSGLSTIELTSEAVSPGGQSLFLTEKSDNEISGISINGGGLSSLQSLIRSGLGCTRLHLRDLRVINTAASQGAVYLNDATHIAATDVYIEAFVGTLAAQTAKCHGFCLIQTTKGASYHKINGITVMGGNFGCYIKNQQSCSFSDLLIVGPVKATADSGDGFNFDNNDHCSVNNLVVTGREDAGLVVYSDVTGQIPRYNVFSNVTSTFNTLDGVYVAAGRYNQFHNIVALNNNQGTPAYGERYGVYVNVDSGDLTQYNSFTGILATDDQAVPTQSYGLAIAAGVADCQFYNCYLIGNVTGTFVDSGTSTLITFLQDSYRLGSKRGFVIANGGDSISSYSILNAAGTGKRILYAVNDGVMADGTRLQSAGGGIEFLGSDGTTVLGYFTDAGVAYLLIDGSLKQITVGTADSGGAGYKLLRVPN